MDGHSVSLREESGLAQVQRLVKIGVLPDDVLVEIFNFYVKIRTFRYWKFPLRNTWHTLVHVCCRWRYLLFSSPHYLNLQLEYAGHRPMSEALNDWPVLPVILTSYPGGYSSSNEKWDNLVAALESEQYNRICEIEIVDMTYSRLERFAAAMQKPFPELTRLEVWAHWKLVVPALPDSFLGGSAPRLETVHLENIPFPSLPTLLLSANGLETLTLSPIPDSGYFSPHALATALTGMTRLKYLAVQFRSPRPRSDPASRPLPPPTRFVLPALTLLRFWGDYGYGEDLLARFDAPLLSELRITFVMDRNSDTPHLHRLISHAPQFKALDHAHVSIFRDSIELSLFHYSIRDSNTQLIVKINFGDFDLPPSSLAQVCSSSFPLISTLEGLEITTLPSSYEIDDTQWLDLFDPFTAVKDLYLTSDTARRVCSAFQGFSGEMATEVLPALRNLFVDASGSRTSEFIQEALKPFVAARQLSGQPVAIKKWRKG